MAGLVSMKRNTVHCESQAADEVYARSVEGDFVDRNWRFFTGLMRMRFCNGNDGDEWERVVDFKTVLYASEAAEYLQYEYDRLVYHESMSIKNI